ncbi:unnamed protein product [Urochloa decumbens]|uniref:F-box domain-containing protein n=1 Tax=Urochloa decumbens TaxID=240449 RepID=A0ABC9BEY6_9POAL
MEPSPRRRRILPPQPDAAAEPGETILDSLPPELLSEILSRLPLRCAVRTAALARAWRRRWESVPSLRIKWRAGADPDAITGVLRRYSCPVIEFSHSHNGEASFHHSGIWLRVLALRGVQTLDLDFERSDEEFDEESDEQSVHTLHPSIFWCRGLTVLRLSGCNIATMPPGFAGFPNLTKMTLFNVGFPDGPRELEALVAASPLLETLRLLHLEVPYSNGEYLQWAIQAPKLRYLFIDQIVDYGWQIADLPSLEEADIDVAMYSTHRDFVKLMTGLDRTKKLKISIPPEDVNVLEGLSCRFNNLKSLSLQTSLHLLSGVLSLFCLLRNAPNLEVLDIELYDDYSEDDEVDNDFLNAQWADDLFLNLVCVGVTHLTCKLSEMRFIEFVLSKARGLREFHVCLDEGCSKSNEEAVTELVKYRRASPRAKVFFCRADYD